MTDSTLSELLWRGLGTAAGFWWVYVPVLFAVGAYSTWMFYQRRKFILGLDWVLLEVIPPPDVPKSPKLAESIFAGLHGIYGVGTAWRAMFFKGEVPPWFSFETVSHGGEIHFLIRSPEKLRNVVEANIFAQYPDAEIKLVDDYISLLPENLPDAEDFDFFSAELMFSKDNAYPIKTWREFEEAGGKDEHARIDPIAPLMEAMSSLRAGEFMWIQYLIRPTGGDWVKEGQAVVDELTGKEKKESDPAIMKALGVIPDAVGSVLEAAGALEPSEAEEKKDEKEFSMAKLTPSQQDVLKAVGQKLSKLAFKSGIRLLYAGNKEVFMPSRISSMTGMYKQLYFNNLNSFRPNMNAFTTGKGVFSWIFPSGKGLGAKAEAQRKKRLLWERFQERAFTEKYVILNVEELATLWHLPGINVQAPLIPRVQAKKGQPPSFLPTE